MDQAVVQFQKAAARENRDRGSVRRAPRPRRRPQESLWVAGEFASRPERLDSEWQDAADYILR
jgi:hypothetical protein